MYMHTSVAGQSCLGTYFLTSRPRRLPAGLTNPCSRHRPSCLQYELDWCRGSHIRAMMSLYARWRVHKGRRGAADMGMEGGEMYGGGGRKKG